MQSGTPTFLRQRANVLDIAQAICGRSNRVLGFVIQHRVRLLVKGLCRAVNSWKSGLIVDVLRIACNGLCTAARFHSAEESSGCILGCLEDSDRFRHQIFCPTLFDHYHSLWPGTGECISPTAIFNDFLVKIVVRSDRHCILVSGLLHAFVIAFNLRRTNRGLGINFRVFLYGRVKMMTALCLAWAHTYHSMYLGFNPDQLQPTAFPVPKPEKHFSMLPSSRTTTRMTGIEFSVWRRFSNWKYQASR